MKKTSFFVLIGCFIVGAFFTFSVVPNASAEEVRLKLVSGWKPPASGTVVLERFVQEINKENAGIKIDFLGGPEVAPQMEQVESLKRGAFDLCFTTPSYYTGMAPAVVAALYVDCSPSELRESGFWRIFDEIHRKRVGVTALGHLWRGENFAMYLKKPISKADLTGFKIRSIPQYDRIIRKMGGVPTTIDLPETYSALQRGVVDGTCHPLGTIVKDFKFYEVVKYILYPPMPQVTSGYILANAKRWDGLPETVKKIIMDKILELEPVAWEYYRGVAKTGVEELLKLGMEINRLPPAEGEKFTELCHNAQWETVLDLSPEWGAKLKESVAPFLKR